MAKGIKTGGRTKGSTNKPKREMCLIKELNQYILDGYYSKFKEELDSLSSKEFISLYLKLYGIKNTELETIYANEQIYKLFLNKINKQLTLK
jgi:hypothetical protein